MPPRPGSGQARSLPPRPSLEHLRKQAKDVLAAHKAGDAAACETLRLLRRFARAPDDEILAVDVSLQEVQHALAQDYGFRDWAALKAYVSQAAPLRFSSAEGNGDEQHRRALRITLTDVRGTSASPAAGEQYVVRGKYALTGSGVARLRLSALGRSRGKPAQISPGSGTFELTAEIIAAQPGGERTLDILMADEAGRDLGVHTRIALEGTADGAQTRKASTERMLHVHCGDSSAETLRRSGVPGDVRVWCDPLIEGPTPAGVSDEEWQRIRAEYHVSVGNAKTVDDNLRWQRQQNEALETFADYDEVVLWFDACLFDQTILIRHLDWFSRCNVAKAGTGTSPLRSAGASPRFRLSLICVGEFVGFERFKGLGELTPEQLASLLDQRHEVTPAEIDLGVKAWAAYRSSDPTDIETLLASDTSALPYLKTALTHHLQLFPSVRNGLNIVEESILRESVRLGPKRAAKLVGEILARTDLPFLSDTQALGYAANMASANVPLLKVDDPGALLSLEGRKQTVAITEMGRDVLDGKADAIALNGIDRWLGGVHLIGDTAAWRWDKQAQTLRPASS